MRISFILPYASLAGGVRVVAIYAERLRLRGHEITVVSTPRIQPSMRQRVAALVKERRLLGFGESHPSHFDALEIDHRVIARHRPVVDRDVPHSDVVIATWWETAEWVAALSPTKGVKAYFVQHDERVIVAPEERERVAATYRSPLHKITIAQWLVDMLRDEFEADCVSLVSNSVDTAQFFAPHRARHAVPTVGFLYSHAEFKGCDTTLAAIELARQSLPELRVVCYGADEPVPRLPLPAGAEFHFRPAQDLIRNIYAQCDAWLFGSRTEGFGLPLLEAMACRTPVIATPAGAAPELTADGGGILLPTFDASTMARAIVDLAAMANDVWQNMSDNAYRTARHYSWDDATLLFEQSLQRAVNASAEARRGAIETSVS